MSVPVPLAVRLANGDVDKHVTGALRDLSFGAVCPGGFASATFSLDSPIALGAPELAPYTRVYVYDTHTARTVWQGYLEEPGRGAGSDGQVWSVTAYGPSTRAQDRTEPLVYIDRTLDPYYRANNTVPGNTQAVVSSNPADTTDDQVLLLQFDSGALITTGSRVSLKYSVLADAGLDMGGFGYGYQMGAAVPTFFELQAVAFPSGSTVRSQGFQTAAATSADSSCGSAFTVGQNAVVFRIERISGGATTVATDDRWAAVRDPWVRMMIYDKTGTAISGAATYTNDYIGCAGVVNDLLGRGLLPTYDAAGASVAVPATHINQLAYPDGVTPAQVLDDLIALEPTYYWAAWEGDLSRFEYAAWPTTVTYEADIDDGFSASNSTEGLYNRVTVRWRDRKGGIQSSRYSQTVQVLTDAGITRRAQVDLGDEVSSQTNADAAGANFLADHAVAANAGSLTLARPVRNLKTGRMEAQWEVRPGTLIRVRGMPAAPGPLNATGSDGQSVMRVVSTDYSASSNTVTLELDTYTRSLTRALAARTRKR